ncbi:sucrase ferredoxin [Pseudonocardia nigra]|uniref:sucrase ferredoxin n=1 Tax=Pseudonocardia nigra TaxID=1921578 RepID=UPI001C5CC435|nr:sucrase ferredoxin [Pseudonocardia nigra]
MDGRCAVLARVADEPLAGTAPVAPRWVCLEHRGAWPREVAEHPDPAVRAFVARAGAAGWRVLLIRRPGRRGDGASGPTRVYLTHTAPQVARTARLTIAGPSELADVPLPERGAPLPGAPVRDPLLLVCTHGRRDRCCALDGRALAVALAGTGEPDVWECSHLGGHRFAPTALVLPTGYVYGRLDAATAVAVRKAAGAGEVETALCRGRSTWSPAGQVAELAVRAATGLRDADALEVADTAGGAVVDSRDGRRWAVEVHSDEVPAQRPPPVVGRRYRSRRCAPPPSVR